MTEEEEQFVEAFRQIVIDELLPETRAIRLEFEACTQELRDARVDAELRRMVGL
jgi:hypothetical protein